MNNSWNCNTILNSETITLIIYIILIMKIAMYKNIRIKMNRIQNELYKKSERISFELKKMDT